MAKPATTATRTPAERAERLAERLHRIAFDLAEPSRSIQRSERIMDEIETIAAETRALARGR